MQTQRWTYGGKYLNSSTLVDLWYATDQLEALTEREAQQVSRLYKRFGSGSILGGIYEVQATESDDGHTQVSGNPTWTGDYCDRPVKLQLAAADSIARTNHRRLRFEKAEADKDELDIALMPLIQLAGKCRNRYEKDALMATVLRRMNDAW